MRSRDALNFIAEAGVLKRIARSGWWMIGIPHRESVADHSFRCAVVGYVLAKMEKADPYRVLLMTLFGDLPEARINDLHKVAARYIDLKKIESGIYSEQIKLLANNIRRELHSARREYDGQRSREARLARDADILECLVQAKEYCDLGYKTAEKFLKKAPGHLRTKSAKGLWRSMKKWDSNTWWERLTKFER